MAIFFIKLEFAFEFKSVLEDVKILLCDHEKHKVARLSCTAILIDEDRFDWVLSIELLTSPYFGVFSAIDEVPQPDHGGTRHQHLIIIVVQNHVETRRRLKLKK
jgi:hypothetical protein